MRPVKLHKHKLELEKELLELQTYCIKKGILFEEPNYQKIDYSTFPGYPKHPDAAEQQQLKLEISGLKCEIKYLTYRIFNESPG